MLFLYKRKFYLLKIIKQSFIRYLLNLLIRLKWMLSHLKLTKVILLGLLIKFCPQFSLDLVSKKLSFDNRRIINSAIPEYYLPGTYLFFRQFT